MGRLFDAIPSFPSVEELWHLLLARWASIVCDVATTRDHLSSIPLTEPVQIPSSLLGSATE